MPHWSFESSWFVHFSFKLISVYYEEHKRCCCWWESGTDKTGWSSGVHQIYLADLDLPQFLLVVILKSIFTLSSQAQILTEFIPVRFAHLWITFHLSRNQSYSRPVQNFESLTCGIWDNFQPWLGGCDITRYNVSTDCRQVRAFLYIYSFQSCYPVVTELSQVVSNNVALFIQSVFDKHTEKLRLIGKCIYTDGHREDFLFLLSGDKCIQR